MRGVLHRLERTLVLHAELGTVWEFFADPRNLPEITPPWLDLRLVSPVPDRMYPGLLLEYRVRPFGGLAWPWVAEITHIREGSLFVDEQRLGPYRLWHHEHHFRIVPGGVEVRDLVVYALPGGWLGDRLLAASVARRLEAIFQFREVAVRRRFSGSEGPGV
ncbi:MAG: SRPBCC family protein [Armatimonadetes bacterium]|nr:SRPBCC family protein [Armatimonadota bacterium]MDW8154668.1 SRPBCC family protein [Armatimonadota bacterium]